MRPPVLAIASLTCFLVAPAWTQSRERVEQSAPSSTSTVAQVTTPRQIAEARANVLMARKMYPEAITAYQQLLRQDPRNAMLLNQVGIAYQQESNWGEASRYYHRALKADGNFATALNNLGTIEYGKRKYRKAIQFYQKALKLRGDEPTFYSNLGYACMGDKQYESALTAFRKALQLDPSHFENRGSGGSVISERSTSDAGFLYYFIAKTYALAGNAERCAHYLKMARDEGYKKFIEAQKDPAFEPVRSDPRVREILEPSPAASNSSGGSA